MKNTKENCHVQKDDKVKILTGKDEGKIGKVMKVFNKKNRVLVENVNMLKRHTKPSQGNPQGGIMEVEGPIHWSNVQLVCNKCLKPSRVKLRILEDGKKVRVCKKCDEIIDT